MRTVSKRDLNQRTASVLDQATDAGDVVVTERGQPRWVIRPFHDQTAPLARMERDGRYTPPAEAPVAWPSHPGGPTYTEAEVESLLDDMRGEH